MKDNYPPVKSDEFNHGKLSVALINCNMQFQFNEENRISGRPLELRNFERVINLGLLSLATYLEHHGHSVKIFDLVDCDDDLEIVEKVAKEKTADVVGFSCISCYGYVKLKKYAELIKNIDKNIFTVAGGQHISCIPSETINEIPHLDCVVKGEGEYILKQLLDNLAGKQSLKSIPSIIFRDNEGVHDNTLMMAEPVDLDTLPYLNYELYPNYLNYSPHIEESRSCAFSCGFCVTKKLFGAMRFKSIPRFVGELAHIASKYKTKQKDVKFFFACATFGLSKKRLTQFIDEMKKQQIDIHWRTGTRVDAPIIEYIDQLAEVGLRVLDLGLESSSQKMLTLMNKTKNPQRYLERASEFIKRFEKHQDVSLKINLVFYTGETPQTLLETFNFISGHAQYIDGISAGPVMLYKESGLMTTFDVFRYHHGASVVPDNYCDAIHAHQVNPSATLSYQQANDFALLLSKMFFSAEKYHEIKSFGQYSPTFDYPSFKEAIDQLDSHDLPFIYPPGQNTEIEPEINYGVQL